MSEASAGKELIDATQEAVIDAVNDVGNIIMTTSEEISGGNPELFYESAEFWVGAAFVVVVVLLFSPLKKAIDAMISGKIAGVIDEMDSAKALRDEARSVLADYEQKMEDLDNRVKAIVDEAKKKAKDFNRNELKRIEKELSVQEKDAEVQMERYKEQIMAETTAVVVRRTMDILNKALRANLDDKSKSDLIESSIDALEQLRKSQSSQSQ